MSAAAELRERFQRAGQGQVFAAWETLDETQQARLAAQAEAVDLDLVAHLATLAREAVPTEVPSFEPPEVFPLERDAALEGRAKSARAAGAEEFRAGRVGFVLVAGGQGSRLGFDGPKGVFPVGPVSGCSLFAWHARRLLAAQRRWSTATPLYVMTSETNDQATRAFFEEHEAFGLEPDDVFFFKQAMLPALDVEGRVLMSAPDSIFLAPNGHGGSLAALASSGALADARARGLEVFSYFQVDNPLARPTDPLFLGLHLEAGARMSSKVVGKRDPAEKVGVLGRANGRLGCIEYSDLPADLREARLEDGRLLFRAGNIAVHLIQRSFVAELSAQESRAARLQLPWHVARKRMAVHEASRGAVECEGFKFETFVFDALAHAEHSVTLEVDRRLEFSPIKNAEGEDSPASARHDMTRLFSTWLAAAEGGPAPLDERGDPWLEIDPRLAEDETEFLAAGGARPRRDPRVHPRGGWIFE
jgi:UDP-N-acetylglucosamine/UDP-N-acetylgalactosamine diphosphorylase